MSGIIKPPFGTPLIPGHPLGPAGGLVCCLPFWERGGNKAYDVSGQGNHGTLVNMADPPTPTSGWGPGPQGGALAFDRINDRIDIPYSPRINLGQGPFTCLLYLCVNILDGTDQVLLEFRGSNPLPSASWVFFIEGGTGKLRIWNGSSLLAASTNALTANVDTWMGLTNSGANGTITYYMAGKPSGTASGNLPATDPTGLRIGLRQDGACGFSGRVSAIPFFNRALSASEIAEFCAYPHAMFDQQFPAWMMPNNIPALANYYRQLRAA